MRKFFSIMCLALISMLSMTSCSNPGVDVSEELVKIQKPWLFGSGGVIMEPLTEGRQILALSTDFVRYNVKPKKYDEKFNDITTYDNNPVADMEYMTTFTNMTVNQYLTLRSLEIEKEKIEMVKGKDKVSIVMASGANGPVNTIPLI